MADNKYDFFATHSDDVNDMRNKIRHQLTNKYYNVWITKYKWNGLDEEVKEQQENYIMRKFWSDGTVASFPIKNTDLLGYAPYVSESFNMYDYTETLRLINKRGVSKEIIPDRPLTVNKEVVIGYCLPSRKSVQSIVSHYVDKMVEVELILNSNLNLQRMPFVLSCNKVEEKNLKNTIEKVLSGEEYVVTSPEDLSKIQALLTQVPYLADKLTDKRDSIEAELLTILGIDNNSNNKTHITVDAIDANNEEINNYDNAFWQEINHFIDRINKTFNRNISIESVAPEVKAVSEEGDNDNEKLHKTNIPDNE